MKQIDSSHYDFTKYMHLARWSCYYTQIKKTIELKPKRILEIGPGDGVYGWYMQKNGIAYRTVDHADDIESDYKAELGSEKLPVEDNSYDFISAFQVLEHIEFEKIPEVLKELRRVSSKYVFLDIPQYGFHLNLAFKIPLLPYLQFHAVLPRPAKHTFDGFHYWEIGKRGFARSKVRKLIEKEFKILEEFSIFQNPKERYYILEVKE